MMQKQENMQDLSLFQANLITTVTTALRDNPNKWEDSLRKNSHENVQQIFQGKKYFDDKSRALENRVTIPESAIDSRITGVNQQLQDLQKIIHDQNSEAKESRAG